MKALRLFAVFFSMLVIMMPVAFAQQISVIRFSGKDNFNNFARESDSLYVVVNASMPGATSETAKERLLIVDGEGTASKFDSCTLTAGTALCTYSTQNIISSGTEEYAIRLYNAEGTLIESTTQTLTIDSLKPEVVEIDASPKIIGKGTVKISFIAQDYASEYANTEICSGIKEVSISAGATQIAKILGSPKTCQLEAGAEFSPSASTTVCATAKDYLNQQSAPKCINIIVDTKKPELKEFALKTPEGFEIRAIRPGIDTRADIYALITDDSEVLEESVTAQLSKLNPNLGEQRFSQRTGDYFVWQNIPITTPQTCSVTITATDILGNTETKTLSCTLPVDETGPVPKEISTGFSDLDGTMLIGKTGKITVSFEETGAGMDSANAYLNLAELGLSPQQKADSCSKKGALWECVWNVIPAKAEGDFTISLAAQTRDNLDNAITQGLQAKTRVDKVAPVIKTVPEVFARTAERPEEKRDNVANGELLRISVVADGFDAEKSFADFSELGGDSRSYADCTGSNCSFYGTVFVSGPLSAKIPITFIDKAGNNATTEKSVFVLGIATEPNPNYWRATTECSPKLIDRNIASLYELPVYCRIKLNKINPNLDASVLSVIAPDLSECTGDTMYVLEMSSANTGFGTKEPYLVFQLSQARYAFDELKITCPVKIMTKVGTFYAQNPETENATVRIGFYNLPAGELSENLDKKIENAFERANDHWRWLSSLKKLVSLGELICNIYNGLWSLVGTVAVVIAGLDAISKTPLFGEAVTPAETGLCYLDEGLRKTFESTGIGGAMDKGCKFISCQWGAVGLDINKIFDEAVAAESTKFGKTVSEFAKPDVKGSLVLSTASLCLPGIIHNLDKLRQIDCRYAVCLARDVVQYGVPVSACTDQKNYMTCRFVVGEVFYALPWTNIMNTILERLKKVLSDPVSLILGLAVTFTKCDEWCAAQQGIAYTVCASASIISMIGKTISYIKGFGDQMRTYRTSDDWCKLAQRLEKDFKNKKPTSTPQAGTGAEETGETAGKGEQK